MFTDLFRQPYFTNLRGLASGYFLKGRHLDLDLFHIFGHLVELGEFLVYALLAFEEEITFFSKVISLALSAFKDCISSFMVRISLCMGSRAFPNLLSIIYPMASNISLSIILFTSLVQYTPACILLSRIN